MYIENYKEELMEYIKHCLGQLPYKGILLPYNKIEMTAEHHAGYEHGILFDMIEENYNEKKLVMLGCIWYDCGTMYIKRNMIDYIYTTDTLYYGHPDACVGFEEFLKSQLPKVPVGILKLPERVV